jgi:hypothetical protein
MTSVWVYGRERHNISFIHAKVSWHGKCSDHVIIIILRAGCYSKIVNRGCSINDPQRNQEKKRREIEKSKNKANIVIKYQILEIINFKKVSSKRYPWMQVRPQHPRYCVSKIPNPKCNQRGDD